MNCEEFKGRLYEYLDETLAGDVQASVGEHLRQCGGCRRAVLREKAVAQSLRHSLDCATAGLSLRPETLRNVLEAWESKPIPTNGWMHAWQWFISSPIRPVGAGAALLGALLLFFGLQAHRQPAENSASPGIAQTGRDAYVVDVPIQTQTHLFRRQNGTVMDAITPSVAVGHARFPDPDNSAKSL